MDVRRGGSSIPHARAAAQASRRHPFLCYVTLYSDFVYKTDILISMFAQVLRVFRFTTRWAPTVAAEARHFVRRSRTSPPGPKGVGWGAHLDGPSGQSPHNSLPMQLRAVARGRSKGGSDD
jgi:hypothetical protein